MTQAQTHALPDGRTLKLLQASPGDVPADWASALGLGSPVAVVLLAGGDDDIPDALQPRITQLVARGLLRTLNDLADPLAGTAGACCVVRACGPGLPALLGQAAADSGGAVTVLGVAPAGVLALPGVVAGAGSGAAPAVAGLSHLLATSGAAWGDELAAKFNLAQALATPGPRNSTQASQAPQAAPQPLLLVIGGGAGAGAVVLLAVRRGWPVLLVDGSGGAADALAHQLAQGQADGDDPVVAEILADGRFTCITLGDRAAGAVESLARALQRECACESLLRLAWQRCAALGQAARQQQKDFTTVQGWITVLGVAVVFLSVLHSVAGAHNWDDAVAGLRYVLIAVPILVSTLIVVANRYSPGKRWVLLRAAAESLKREIYRYRVRPRHAAVDGVREKALQQAMEDITRRLARTEVNSMGLPPYTGPLPPPSSLARGDDGMSLLGADRYVRLRLADQLDFYSRRSAGLAGQSSRWQLVAIVVGALGTLLAALGGEWVAWVALTSAVASAALAYVGYKQFDTTLTGYNQTATDLQNLQAWWTALLPDEQALPENVDKLVTTTETVLATEQDGWAQSMTNALVALRSQQPEGAAPAPPGG